MPPAAPGPSGGCGPWGCRSSHWSSTGSPRAVSTWSMAAQYGTLALQCPSLTHWTQRVAMAAKTGHWEPSHTRQLEDLGLERLSTRRTRLCEQFARRTATNSRHIDLFTPVNSLQRRAKHAKKYREISTRTQTYFKSALPYLTRLLNQL